MRLLRYLLVLFSLLLCSLTWAQDLKIYFLNVGQGDGILVITPDGKSLVYDAGRARDRAADMIRALGITQVDIAVASQGDADHIGGLEGVALRLRPRFFLNNGIASTTATYQRVIQAMQAAGAQGLLATERTIELGNSVKVQVLATPTGVPRNDQNANSVGILIQFGGFKAFFGGDAEPLTLRGWIAKYGALLKDIDLYKAAHHGSRYNDIAEFINLLRPQDVGIGVGANNSYGHPSPEALALYQGVGAGIWRTDLNGTILVTVRPDGSYTVSAELGNAVARVARGASALTPPARTPPLLVGLLNLQGRTLYVYAQELPLPPPGLSNPNLITTVVINGATLYVYDGLAP